MLKKRQKLNELQKACNAVINKRQKGYDDPWNVNYGFLDYNDLLAEVKEKLNDPKIRLYYIDTEEAVMEGAEYTSVIDIWKENLNKRIKEILIADVDFETTDGGRYGKVIMVR